MVGCSGLVDDAGGDGHVLALVGVIRGVGLQGVVGHDVGGGPQGPAVRVGAGPAGGVHQRGGGVGEGAPAGVGQGPDGLGVPLGLVDDTSGGDGLVLALHGVVGDELGHLSRLNASPEGVDASPVGVHQRGGGVGVGEGTPAGVGQGPAGAPSPTPTPPPR